MKAAEEARQKEAEAETKKIRDYSNAKVKKAKEEAEKT